MTSDTIEAESNWFEQNPRKTLSFIFIFIFILFIVSLEKILEYKSGVKKDSSIRYIRLREHPANTNTKQEFGELNSDGTKKYYNFRTDGNGFIEPSEVYKKADVNIVFLGGSTTECFAVDEEKRFPFLSADILSKRLNIKVNGFNSGVMGNHSMHSNDILINKIIPMKPDIVVMMHNINDLSILIHEGGYWNTNPYRSLIVEKEGLSFFYLLRSIKNFLFPYTYELIKEKINLGLIIGNITNKAAVDEFKASRFKESKINQEKIIEDFTKSLKTFISICHIHNITPVLMTQANRITKQSQFYDMEKRLLDKGIGYNEYYNLYSAFNQKIIELALKNNVKLIDLDNNIPHTDKYLIDQVHYNTIGSELAAKVISDSLFDYIIKNNEKYHKKNSL